MDRSCGTVMGIAGPAVSRSSDGGGGGCVAGSLLSPVTFLTKICMVSADSGSSGEADRDINVEGMLNM